LFFISSQEFALHLDTGDSGLYDEAGVAGTPDKFTLIVFSVNQGYYMYVHHYHTHIIEISKLYF